MECIAKKDPCSNLIGFETINNASLYMEIVKLHKKIDKLDHVHQLINMSAQLRRCMRDCESETLYRIAKKRLDSINANLCDLRTRDEYA